MASRTLFNEERFAFGNGPLARRQALPVGANIYIPSFYLFRQSFPAQLEGFLSGQRRGRHASKE
jgi:hypothetical protein